MIIAKCFAKLMTRAFSAITCSSNHQQVAAASPGRGNAPARACGVAGRRLLQQRRSSSHSISPFHSLSHRESHISETDLMSTSLIAILVSPAQAYYLLLEGEAVSWAQTEEGPRGAASWVVPAPSLLPPSGPSLLPLPLVEPF